MAAKGSERIVVIVCACSEDADEVRTIFARNKTPLEADFSNPQPGCVARNNAHAEWGV